MIENVDLLVFQKTFHLISIEWEHLFDLNWQTLEEAWNVAFYLIRWDIDLFYRIVNRW